MKTLAELQEQYYEEFKGLPGYRPIVRNNQIDDAFELVVLKVLYGKHLPDFIKSNAVTFAEYIIAPPDEGIDIFFQHENGDECTFDIIQVKHENLGAKQIESCFSYMKRTIDNYCTNPKDINSENCKTILSNSSLDKTNKANCKYYVIHAGSTEDFSGSKEDEIIITFEQLNTLYNNVSEYVDYDEIHITDKMMHQTPADNNCAIVCSLNGYDLAKLCSNYNNTSIGRNILFGSNLRESLITKKSKPYNAMKRTILECPENFWYYNNGITIIAQDIADKGNDNIELKGFSIVNGAQTTSALGLFLKEATKNHELTHIEQLKRVFVLTRILKVPDDEMRQDIAIYNNTQNPITSRDMVANRLEQKHLNEWLLDDDYAQIYCEIRRGSVVPAKFNKGFTHRSTTNEELAQLAYAGFMQRPFIAKDKKSSLFTIDPNPSEYVVNKIYHDIFFWDADNSKDTGLIFTKGKQDIDELLFIRHLYNHCKKLKTKEYKKKKAMIQENIENAKTPEEIDNNKDRMALIDLSLNVIGICVFYFIALYYEYKAYVPENERTDYRYDKFYSDKKYREELIEEASNLFLMPTVSILQDTAKNNGHSSNVGNWVRNQKCETAFINSLREKLTLEPDYEKRYKDFCKKFKA